MLLRLNVTYTVDTYTNKHTQTKVEVACAINTSYMLSVRRRWGW